MFFDVFSLSQSEDYLQPEEANDNDNDNDNIDSYQIQGDLIIEDLENYNDDLENYDDASE